MKILIGSETGDHVEMVVVDWAIDQPDNPVDAAWLATEISVAAGPLGGRFWTELRREDVVSWQDNLSALDTEFQAGDARFSASLEPSIGLLVVVSSTGRLSVEGWVEPSLGEWADQRLVFRFPTQQSLREVVRQVDDLLRQFPDRASALE